MARADYYYNCRKHMSPLTHMRLFRHLSQVELASYVGVSRNTISNIENGAEPSVGLALRLSEVLNCSVKYLFEYNMGDWENEFNAVSSHFMKSDEYLFFND